MALTGQTKPMTFDIRLKYTYCHLANILLTFALRYCTANSWSLKAKASHKNKITKQYLTTVNHLCFLFVLSAKPLSHSQCNTVSCLNLLRSTNQTRKHYNMALVGQWGGDKEGKGWGHARSERATSSNMRAMKNICVRISQLIWESGQTDESGKNDENKMYIWQYHMLQLLADFGVHVSLVLHSAFSPPPNTNQNSAHY